MLLLWDKPEWSMKRLVGLVRSRPGLVMLLLALATSWGGWVLRERMLAQRLRQTAHQLQLALEAYAVRSEGAYPSSLGDPAFAALFSLPPNPYGGGRMRTILPDQPARPGDVVYVPSSPVIVVAGGRAMPLGWRETAPSGKAPRTPARGGRLYPVRLRPTQPLAARTRG
jgi:hypothetical protein